MIVVDPDKVEASNLTRSILFRVPSSTGRNKAIVVAEAMSQLFPDTECVGFGLEIADLGFREIGGSDIIFSCADSDLARLEIAYAAVRLDVPVSDGGLGGDDYSRGRVTYFPGARGACYGCLLSDHQRAELLTLWESSSRPCWRLASNLGDESVPSTPTMAAIVGALQVDFGMRRVLQPALDKSGAHSLELFLDPVLKLDSLLVGRSKTCPFHSGSDDLILTPSPASAATVRELLDSVAGRPKEAELVLDWPICARARCVQCGLVWSPMMRLARLRRSGVCPTCAGRRIAELEIIRSVGDSSKWIDYKLAELGQPDNHLYSIRLARDTN